MGRVYTASFEGIAVAAAQDLITLGAPATSMVEILSARMGQYLDFGDAEAEMRPVAWNRVTAAGSGGGSATVTPHKVGDAAFGGTADSNDTTQGSTPTLIMPDVFNVMAGYLYVPIPEERIWIPPSGFLSLEITVLPADSLTMSGSITFIEHD